MLYPLESPLQMIGTPMALFSQKFQRDRIGKVPVDIPGDLVDPFFVRKSLSAWFASFARSEIFR